jgi:hypothetical protein
MILFSGDPILAREGRPLWYFLLRTPVLNEDFLKNNPGPQAIDCPRWKLESGQERKLAKLSFITSVGGKTSQWPSGESIKPVRPLSRSGINFEASMPLKY